MGLYSFIFQSLQIVFIGVLLIFFVSWCYRIIVSVVGSWIRSLKFKDETKDEDGQKELEFKMKQDVWKQSIQKMYEEKTAKYKENVLIPRENEKRERREKEFQKHFGQVFSGSGITLGGEDETSGDEESNLTENERAARRRQIPEPDVADTKVPKKKIKPKRVIELPVEPDESDPAVILVIIRTPISTTVSRRFHCDHKFQSVLDFMTTSGFSDCHYEMCTSFPRVLLTDPEVSLSELGFEKRTILNIEEKTSDS